jgi:hypothetical protein
MSSSSSSSSNNKDDDDDDNNNNNKLISGFEHTTLSFFKKERKLKFLPGIY